VLLLDTHVWVWTLEGDERRIGRRTRVLLERAKADDAIRVSPISLFEVTALQAAGHLRLSQSLEPWLESALDGAGIRLASLSRESAVDAGLLARTAVPDPLDRLLIASARQLDATFVTADRRILDYAGSAYGPRVHDARR